MEEILQGLNPRQKEAVQIIKGPVLVLSGPGSGKTKVLTHRVAYLIQEGIQPENILAVTFTNKAADEMKSRIISLLEVRGMKYEDGEVRSMKYEETKNLESSKLQTSDFRLPLVGTFHAVCAQLLRKEAPKIGYKTSFTIYDDSDQLSLIKKVIGELQIDPKQFSPQGMAGAISGLKAELISPEIYSEEAVDYFPEILAKIYLLYQKKLKENNAFDFDDLIMKVVEIFRRNPEVLEKYQNKFGYVLVDEYQDIDTGQFVFLKLLAEKHRNIFVIGDEAQNIYSFRGADFRNILNFERDWPEAKVIILEENYRSPQNILDAAYNVIVRSPNFRDKKLWTKKGGGEPLIIQEVEDEKEEAEFVVAQMKKLKINPSTGSGLTLSEVKWAKNKKDYNDFVILYRTNAQSRAVEEAFLQEGIPYKIIGGVKFYERKEIKDIVAWLRLCINPQDTISRERISKTSLQKSKIQSPRPFGARLAQQSWAAKSKIPRPERPGSRSQSDLGINPKSKILNFLIKDFSERGRIYNLTKLINYILEKTGYEDYIRDGSEEGEERWKNIQELLTVAAKYDDFEPPSGLQKFLEEIALLTQHDEVETKKDVVNLMTFHAAKGLEFPIVFILGCEEGIFPHSKSLNSESGLDEERRLCYVALTRAKEKVYLVFTKKRRLFGITMANPPSRFLGDIPDHLLKQG